MKISELEGQDLLAIELPADRSYLKFTVSAPEMLSFSSINVRFYNDDGSKVHVDFLTVDMQLLGDTEANSVTFGEFEYVSKVDDGFLITGDFGQILVHCNASSPVL
jgi:hypothetical protein